MYKYNIEYKIVEKRHKLTIDIIHVMQTEIPIHINTHTHSDKHTNTYKKVYMCLFSDAMLAL